MVGAVENTERMGHHGVGIGGAKIVGGKALKDFVREAIGSGEGEFECVTVGDTGAVEIARRGGLFVSECSDLLRSTVDQNHTNVEGSQHGDVQQEVGEIHVRHHRAVGRDDKRLVAEARDVLQDSSEIGGFH